jgi:hypothetical protein
MRKIVLIMLFVVGSISSMSNAGENKSINQETEVERLNKIEGYEKLNSSIDEMRVLVERISRQKNLDCLKAFGDKRFCQCLSDKSPVGISFIEYIQIVTNSKENLEYSKADKEGKALIDNTLKAREDCGKN